MSRYEIIGRIVSQLHLLSDQTFQDLLNGLEDDITEQNLEVVTYGNDDTEHLLSSSRNAEDLEQAVAELDGKTLVNP